MTPDVVVAGHLCLDIIPPFTNETVTLAPGQLTEVGPVKLAPGGGVANVGLALLKLGVHTRLMGRVGDDVFGRALEQLLRAQHSAAGEGIQTVPGENTSYTIVISPPGLDRTFLHHPGYNNRYGCADIDFAQVARAKIFYIGYPPIMRRLYEDDGLELEELLRRAKKIGVTTVMDMAMPDPNADAGQVNWPSLLERVLPFVDIFMPSLEEILLMFDQAAPNSGNQFEAPAASLYDLSQRLLNFGTGIVGLKLGTRGFYLRTASAERLALIGNTRLLESRVWSDRELWSPVFNVNVRGTTGAGDATIAGFVAALLRQLEPEDVLTIATAVGACCVEEADATSGIRTWEETLARIHAGWPRATSKTVDKDKRWHNHASTNIFWGPHDRGGRA